MKKYSIIGLLLIIGQGYISAWSLTSQFKRDEGSLTEQLDQAKATGKVVITGDIVGAYILAWDKDDKPIDASC